MKHENCACRTNLCQRDGVCQRENIGDNRIMLEGLCPRKEIAMTGSSAASQDAPRPPFTRETAIQKVRLAEDGWNSRDPQKVALAYTIDSRWRNRHEFINGRQEIIAFLTRKWARELDYRLIKELWAFDGNRIAVRFAYECHDASGNWFRSYGNENWEFAENGLMRIRHTSINDVPIKESERKYHWPLGRRPDDHPGLSELGL
jgi:nuclear transport factor 2 (NTF2) superfamily protein